MQDLQYSLSTSSRMSYPAMSTSASSPFPSYADPSASYAAFPSKSSLLSLSRQASVDPSFLFSSASFPLSRQVSLSAFHDINEADPFNFPSLVEAGEGELQPFKAEAEAFDLISRVSSFDSDVSSWASNASDDVDGYSAPRSPQSSVDSMSDSSQSDAELYPPYLSAASYPVQDQWAQPHFPKVERQASPSLPLKTENPQVGLNAGAQQPNSPVPVLPLPFHQPVYAFNYHSVEDEPTPQSHSSRHERREGLRGGGDSRHGHSHSHDQQRSAHHLHLRAESDLYAASMASTQPSTATSTAGSSSDAVSPKSLLLSLSRTSALSPAQPSSHGGHHFSPSSSSSSASSTSVTSIHLTGPLDPNEVVIGIYTRAERAAKIARYREKRANRQWRKKILYGCRKSFADNRPRVGGRFIKMKTQEGEDAKAGGK